MNALQCTCTCMYMCSPMYMYMYVHVLCAYRIAWSILSYSTYVQCTCTCMYTFTHYIVPIQRGRSVSTALLVSVTTQCVRGGLITRSAPVPCVVSAHAKAANVRGNQLRESSTWGVTAAVPRIMRPVSTPKIQLWVLFLYIHVQVCLWFIKPGGVPSKLCIFSADEG